MVFILNPYDQVLDLTDRSHLKLYTDGCLDLEKEVKFDGKQQNYKNFVNLIGEKIGSRRIKETLKIVTEWKTTGTTPELPMTADTINLLKNSTSMKKQVEEHVRLVWTKVAFVQS